MIPILVNEKKCTGCSLCVNDCPGGCLQLVNGKLYISQSACIECGHCYAICPQGAIRMANYQCKEEPVVPMTEIDSDTLLKAMRSRSGRSWKREDTARPEATRRAYPIPFWEADRRKRKRSASACSEKVRNWGLHS